MVLIKLINLVVQDIIENKHLKIHRIQYEYRDCGDHFKVVARLSQWSKKNCEDSEIHGASETEKSIEFFQSSNLHKS